MAKSSLESSTQIYSDRIHRIGTFDKQICNIIDETLQSIFQEEGVKAIYRYIEKKHQIDIIEIVENPEILSVSLKKLLGTAGPTIENQILKKIYTELHMEFKVKHGYHFSDYIKEVRKFWIRKK